MFMIDPTIAEIRDVRAKMAEECGNDLQRFLALIKKESQRFAASGEWKVAPELPAPDDVLKETDTHKEL